MTVGSVHQPWLTDCMCTVRLPGSYQSLLFCRLGVVSDLLARLQQPGPLGVASIQWGWTQRVSYGWPGWYIKFEFVHLISKGSSIPEEKATHWWSVRSPLTLFSLGRLPDLHTPSCCVPSSVSWASVEVPSSVSWASVDVPSSVSWAAWCSNPSRRRCSGYSWWSVGRHSL